MHAARQEDKPLVIDILAQAFDDNRSVNYIIPQDGEREQRIRHLMDYSFEECLHFGDVFLSDDNKAVALLLYPDQKKTSLASLMRDIRCILMGVGFWRLRRVLAREAHIKQHHPSGPFCYLWFIGVQPAQQGKGLGSQLLQEVIQHAVAMNRPLYLETSTAKNLPWYQQHGFTIYQELSLAYTLFMLRREAV